MLKISDSIYVYPFEERRDRPNIGLIIGKDRSMLVDFGISKAHLDEVLSDIKQSNLPKPTLGVLTHYHYDHSFAMSYFDGVSIACKRSNSYLRVLSKVKMNEMFLKSYLSGEALSFCLKAMEEEYKGDYSSIKVKTSDIEFENSLRIDLGDKKVELYHMFAPHSDDSVYIKVDDVLFIGDAFFYDIFNGETTYNKEKLEALYVIINSFDVKTIVEGHSEIKSKEKLLDEIKQLL